MNGLCPSAGIIRAANQPNVVEGMTAMTSSCSGSITAEGSERRLQTHSRWTRTRNRSNVVKVRRCSASPEGGALNPLEQMKRGANIFQACQHSEHAHCQICSRAACLGERISLRIHTNIQKNSKNTLKGLTRDLQSSPSITCNNKRRRGLLFYCSRPLECS